MGTPKQPVGIAPATFPRKAQAVAMSHFRTDRSPLEKNQFRRAILAGLAAPGGLILRASPILSLFAASLIMLAPTHALAQEPEDHSVAVRDRPRPEYDPAGVRFGGFDLNASLELAATSNDNIFAEETNTNSDIIVSLSPKARLSSHWSRHALSVEAGGTFPRYQDFSSEEVNTGYARANGRYDVGPNTSISGSAGVAHLVESRLDPDGSPQGAPPVEYDSTDLGVGVRHNFSSFSVSASAGRSEYNYDGAQSFRDFTQDGVTGQIEAQVTPRIGLLLEATADKRDYNNSPTLNSEGQTYLVGATLHLTDLLRGRLAVGEFNRDYDGTPGNSFSESGLAVDANLEWYVTRLTTVTLTGSRNTEDTVGATTAFPYISTRYGVRVDHELLRNLIVGAGAGFGTRDYDGTTLTDDVTHFDVGADYLVSRRWAIRARYDHDELASSGAGSAGRDYEVNRFTVGLAFRL
jgi:hypothetical protein